MASHIPREAACEAKEVHVLPRFSGADSLCHAELHFVTFNRGNK